MSELDAPFIELLRDKLMDRGAESIAPRSLTVAPEDAAAYVRTRPFAEAMFLVMAADGKMSDSEHDVLRGAIRTLSGGALSTKATDAMVTEFQSTLETLGVETHLDQVAAHLWGHKEDEELALALVGAMASVHREDAAAELQMIYELAERLGIERSKVTGLFKGA
jgi:uncharacterized tellurite resistance protein B-like protein